MKNQNQKNTLLAVLATLLLAAPTEAVEINGKLLDAVAFVESNGNHRAVGDQGKANGSFQLHRPAWADAGKWLKANGFKTTTYTKGVNDPSVSRIYARTYLSLIHGQLATRMKREPTAGELYAAYNMGVGGFAKRGFDVRRTPATTRRAIAKLYKAIENPTTKGTK
tara:strand:- start:9029 stop:9526 length:498 start_codon:yes stop_codon:yes gene_type:complete